jgi:hypothetical protein
VTAPLRRRVETFLSEHHVMTLATRGEAGPWAAAVFYAHDGLQLVYLSSPRSRHALELARDPRAAVTIQRDVREWPQVSGVQAEGRVVELSGAECDRARRIYGEKFPVVGAIAQAPRAIAEAFARIRWYRFTPQRLYLIDNTLGFGHRDEVDCAS